VKVRPPERPEEALDYLYRDPFPNASLIAAVERGAVGAVQVRVADQEAVQGVLVVAPGPEGTRSTGLDAESIEAAEALLRALRPQEPLQFGLHRPESVTALNRVCQATPTGVMLAFRHDGPWPRLRDFSPARELTRMDERTVRRARDDPFLYSFMQSVRRHPREGSEVRTFGVIERGRLLSRCLTTWAEEGIERQIGTVWSVYTDPAARGRGMGRAVVAAATAAILDSGRIARYFAFSDNTPSLRICRALGYHQNHAVRYFWAQRPKK
jgi:RimJ/RimL family protein N-acetyltransferase